MRIKSICIIGLGYIGLPTAALLANKGFTVNGVDIDKEVVSSINKSKIHIVEPDLSEFVNSAISSGKLKAFNKIQTSDVYMICVPTPLFENEDIPKPNINFVLSAVKSISKHLKSGDLIILESTSPVGTTKKIEQLLEKTGVNVKDIHIAYCPERVLPGKIMTELIDNDRIVGGITPASTKKVKEFYSLFVKGNILETDVKTAEMSKLVENSFRDLNIAFANELSIICDNQGINVWDLIRLANKHPRVNILEPGTGVGGHCIAVDPWFIISQDSINTKLIRMARNVNDYKTSWVIDKIKFESSKHFSKNRMRPKIACLGLTFKPDIDDLRESKALKVAEILLQDGFEVIAVEPNINKHKSLSLQKLSDAIEESDIICILVKHSEFLDPEIKEKLKSYGALDFCGALL